MRHIMVGRDPGKSIRILVYATVFLAPLNAFLLYVPLLPALVLACVDRARAAPGMQGR